MKTPTILGLAVVLLLPMGLLTGCGTGGSTTVHGSVSYGVGWYDPWYYGPGSYPPDVIVTPPPPPERPTAPPERPAVGPHPEHPIANPPPARPSIPTTPRPSPRGGRR